MNTQEFQQTYWKYYLNLENDFLNTEKYVTIDKENQKTFSIEYMKILQMICAEIDVLSKVFSKMIDESNKGDTLPHYCKTITTRYTEFTSENVWFMIGNINLIPWEGWSYCDNVDKNGNPRVTGTSPNWWKDHNKIKHSRTLSTSGIQNYKKANQNNVILALAALFQMEMYFYNFLATAESREELTPLPKSKLFSIPRWTDSVISAEELLGVAIRTA